MGKARVTETDEGHTFASIVSNWNTTRRNIAILRRIRNVAKLDTAGEAISDLELCHLYCGITFVQLVGEIRVRKVR